MDLSFPIDGDDLLAPISNSVSSPTKKKDAGSKGVQKIEQLLKGLEIEYRREFTFKKCKDVRCLPFDFMIIVNGMVSVIEYDGKQHFEVVSRFHGSNSEQANLKLIKQKKHDIIKNKYTHDSNISLLRISYQEDEIIEKIIFDFIARLKSSRVPTRVDLFSNVALYNNPYGQSETACVVM